MMFISIKSSKTLNKVTCTEWRSVKPFFGLFRKYWRFRMSIVKITVKGSSCSIFRQEQYLPIRTCPLVDAEVFYSLIP